MGQNQYSGISVPKGRCLRCGLLKPFGSLETGGSLFWYTRLFVGAEG